MSDAKGQVLIIDDKESMLSLLAKVLGEHHDVTAAGDGVKALALLAEREFDVVLTDIRMPGASGFEVLDAVKMKWPRTQVVMMTAYASVPSAVDAMKKGAYDYLQKPFDPDDVALVVARALEPKRRHDSRDAGGPRATPATPNALPAAPVDDADLPYQAFVDRVRETSSRNYLAALMGRFSGNVTRAAEQAGMERESLHRLLKRHGVRAEDFRENASRGGKE